MISIRHYLLRAFYDWIIDNNLTPFITIDANIKGVQVPLDYVDEDRIVLDISPEACSGLHIESDRVLFSASFSGKPMQIYAPPHAVIAIYAKENGQGMVFTEEEDSLGEEDLEMDETDSCEDEDYDEPIPASQANQLSKRKSRKGKGPGPHLKIIK